MALKPLTIDDILKAREARGATQPKAPEQERIDTTIPGGISKAIANMAAQREAQTPQQQAPAEEAPSGRVQKLTQFAETLKRRWDAEDAHGESPDEYHRGRGELVIDMMRGNRDDVVARSAEAMRMLDSFSGEQPTPRQVGYTHEFMSMLDRMQTDPGFIPSAPELKKMSAEIMQQGGGPTSTWDAVKDSVPLKLASLYFGSLDLPMTYLIRKPIMKTLSYTRGGGKQEKELADQLTKVAEYARRGVEALVPAAPEMKGAVMALWELMNQAPPGTRTATTVPAKGAPEGVSPPKSPLEIIAQNAPGAQVAQREQQRQAQLQKWGAQPAMAPDQQREWADQYGRSSFINYLLDEGHPWYSAIAFGLGLEVALDPLNVSGAGVAIKNMPVDKLDDLIVLAAKHGKSVPEIKGITKGTRAVPGLVWRDFISKGMPRKFHGLPLESMPATDKVVQAVARHRVLGAAGRLFTPAGKATGKHLALAESVFGEDAAGKVAFDMYKRSEPHFKRIEEIKRLLWEQAQKETDASFASKAMSFGGKSKAVEARFERKKILAMMSLEHIEPARRGADYSVNAIRRLGVNQEQLELAEEVMALNKSCGEGFEALVESKVPMLHAELVDQIHKHISRAETTAQSLEKELVPPRESLGKVWSRAQARLSTKAEQAREMASDIGEIEQQVLRAEKHFESMGAQVPRETILKSIIAKEEKKAAEAAASATGGISFMQPQRAQASGEKIVKIDVQKFDKSWAADEGFYVAAGGKSASTVPGKYSNAQKLLKSGKQIEMPEVNLGPGGVPSFKDGRNRFAALRDAGVKQIEVSVPADEAQKFKDMFGSNIKPGEVPPPKRFPPVSAFFKQQAPGVSMRSFKTKADLMLEHEVAISKLNDLNAAIEKAEAMHPRDWLATMKRAGLNQAERDDAYRSISDMSAIHAKRARAERWAGLLNRVLREDISKEEAAEMMRSGDKMLATAARINERHRGRIGYFTHVSPRGGPMEASQVARGRKTVDPFAKVGTFQERHFKRIDGSAKSSLEVNDEIETVLKSSRPATELAEQYQYVPELLKNAYGKKTTAEAYAAAQKDLANGIRPVERVIEHNPDAVVQAHFQSLVGEAKRESVAKSLAYYSSDTALDNTWRKASSIDARLGRLYPDKYFPAEIADQYVQWERSMTSLANALGKGGGIADQAYRGMTNVTSLWKFLQTGWRIGFQTRNEVDDLVRFFGEGAYNPITLHTLGTKALAGKGTIYLGKELGSVSAKDAMYLAKAYGVDEGSIAAEALGSLAQTKLKFTMVPERMRRVGHFLTRVQQGMSPLEAAASTKRVAFPASQLAAFERPIRDIAVPFYSFRRQNISFYARKAFTDPGFVRAQMVIGESLKKRTQEGMNAEMQGKGLELLPSFISGSAIHAIRGDVGTSLLTMPGMSINDFTEFLDTAGNPVGAFKALVRADMRDVKRQLNPVPGILSDVASVSASALMKSLGLPGIPSDAKAVPLPKEWEKIPDELKLKLGAVKMPYTVPETERVEERWTIDPRYLRIHRGFGVYNEVKRWLQPESLKAAKDTPGLIAAVLTNPECLASIFTGITWKKSNDYEIAYRMFDDWSNQMDMYMKASGLEQLGEGLSVLVKPSKVDAMRRSQLYLLKKKIDDGRQKLYNAMTSMDRMERSRMRQEGP